MIANLQKDDSSSSDSAYQAALELGSDYYGNHTSERARHRNFRKCKFQFDDSVLSHRQRRELCHC